MAWISNGGEFVVAPKRYQSMATTTSVTNVVTTVTGNDVFGQVKLVVTGTVTQGIVATINPPIPLPESALVWVSPADSPTQLGGIASTIGWYGSINEVGAIAIGTAMTISSALSTANVNYFVAQ
jgi:hypothetical protein